MIEQHNKITLPSLTRSHLALKLRTIETQIKMYWFLYKKKCTSPSHSLTCGSWWCPPWPWWPCDFSSPDMMLDMKDTSSSVAMMNATSSTTAIFMDLMMTFYRSVEGGGGKQNKYIVKGGGKQINILWMVGV